VEGAADLIGGLQGQGGCESGWWISGLATGGGGGAAAQIWPTHTSACISCKVIFESLSVRLQTEKARRQKKLATLFERLSILSSLKAPTMVGIWLGATKKFNACKKIQQRGLHVVVGGTAKAWQFQHSKLVDCYSFIKYNDSPYRTYLVALRVYWLPASIWYEA
jgi:hypothetical protein